MLDIPKKGDTLEQSLSSFFEEKREALRCLTCKKKYRQRVKLELDRVLPPYLIINVSSKQEDHFEIKEELYLHEFIKKEEPKKKDPDEDHIGPKGS